MEEIEEVYEVNDVSEKQGSNLEDCDEEGTAEYLDLDLEVINAPDAEVCYANESIIPIEGDHIEIREPKLQVKSSLLMSNVNGNKESKSWAKYRPIRPKPYQSNIVIDNHANFIPPMMTLSPTKSVTNFETRSSTKSKRKNREVIIDPANIKVESFQRSGGVERSIERNRLKSHEIAQSIMDNTVENKQVGHGKDSIELFFDSMAQTVLSLPMHVQAKIKMDICRLVTMAEIEHSTPTRTFNRH
ncbi:uncharacterized protein LOC107272758 [Cephus cinctus]|uniref:Uncharacterized protein LOC107272758 n=1 Tax=Cephus cinctus TaxID=211228 RepID=A0AAJ7CA52_CEPCN|nr:uncharacterized protein LOC107272758 [Cephus cinctus]